MDNLLNSKPYMSPVTTVSSIRKRTEADSECSTSSVESSGNEKAVHSKLTVLCN